MRRSILVGFAAVLVLALTACEASFNTAMGSGQVRPPSIGTKRVRTVTRTPPPSSPDPVVCETECENGICAPPEPK